MKKPGKRADKKTKRPHKKAKIRPSCEGEASHNIESDFEQQSTNEETGLSTYNEGKLSCNIAFCLDKRKLIIDDWYFSP